MKNNRRGQIVRIPMPIRGEATIYPASGMPIQCAGLLQNCHLSETGGVAKLPGYGRINLNSCGVQLTSGYEYYQSDGKKITLVAGSGKIFRLSGADLDLIHSGLDTSAVFSFAAMSGICVMVNGKNDPLKYDGASVSLLGGNPPRTAYKAHVHKGRMWLLERANPMLATYSALNNPEEYRKANDAGYLDFKYVLRRGGQLLDVQTYVDLQVFFFRDAVAIYSGNSPISTGDYSLVQLIDGTGIRSTDAVQPIGTDMVFLSDAGAKTLKQVVTTGSMNIGDISQIIGSAISSELIASGACEIAHYPARGWLFFRMGAAMRIYSYVYKAWGRMTGATVNGMFNGADGALYLCGNGYLYQYGSGWTYDGVLPVMLWDTAWMSATRQGLQTFPKVLDITMNQIKTTALSVSIMYDMLPIRPGHTWAVNMTAPRGNVDLNSQADFDIINPFDELPVSRTRIPLFGNGRLMKLRFANTSADYVEISDLAMQVMLGGM